ncbi:MAG TPA: serine/threonine-protein kinase, partial [Bacillota bacterium]|nr:serine/threonine-protein kinase [Bacillota bacterium]
MEQSAGKAEAVFAGALELTAGAARDQFLTEQCGGNGALRREVESLLRAHDAAGPFLQEVDERLGFWQSPATGRQSPEKELPRFPGFHLEGKLGEGSLGVVYAARDEKLQRRVAIKVLHRYADEKLRRRVLDEARKAAALNDPAVVTVYSVLDEADPPAIVMEWVEGFPLDRFAAQLSFEQKARLLREVARGLAAAHARGLVHRDLKPENVIVGPDMRPRLLDFGLALSLAEAGGQTGGFEGTPLYASPEQVHGQPV